MHSVFIKYFLLFFALITDLFYEPRLNRFSKVQCKHLHLNLPVISRLAIKVAVIYGGQYLLHF